MKLFSIGNIGNLRLKNRVVMAPLSTNFPNAEGEITPEFTQFYLERAKGGVGLIILESGNVDYPMGKSGYTQLRIDEDRFLPGLFEFIETIHETDTKIALQLNHAGGMFGDRDRSELVPFAPSAMIYGKNRRMAHAITIDEIYEIQTKFMNAAERAEQCGFDAIEIHGANGYLIAEFLSPWTNVRTDSYGGSIENRARFATEIVKGIRTRIGSKYPIIFRISGDELVPGGRHLDETIEIIKLLKEAGITCVHVSAGNNRFPQLPARRGHIEPMSYKQGWKSYMAKEIGQCCNITTIAVGSIRDVEVAERIVNEDADFVAMARQLIADPEWVHKAENGGNIRRCLSCNACVMHRSYYGGKLRCCVNPRCGKEYRTPPPERYPTSYPRKVAVVGGGPAGMEAARVAAIRGFDVTLFEQADHLGGNLIPAGGIDLKYKISWLINWLEKEIADLKVDIRLGVTVSPKMLKDSDYNTIILATGSQPRISPLVRNYIEYNPDTVHIVQAIDLLAGNISIPTGSRVIVLGAGLVGCEAAYKLASEGHNVRLLEGYRTKKNLISNTDQINGNELLFALGQKRVQIWDHTQISTIYDDCIKVNHKGNLVKLPYDILVLAQGQKSSIELAKALNDSTKQIFTVGDCNSARTAFYAMHEGFMASYRL
jgi:2,4-dienoyl-CoA reductase-like NADH-dependent reductase (Old Yellow Enzyme family)/thioredoxin reductase